MHAESLQEMERMLERFQEPAAWVLDVGSLDVNGTYRPLVEGRGWRYTGLDIVDGPNVDIVAADPYQYPIADGAADVVISGSTMEHVEQIWRWVPELVRVLRPGGMLAIVTHWQFPEHKYPVDCWRVLPDGMKVLFDLTGELERYEIRLVNDQDIAALAWRHSRKDAKAPSVELAVKAAPERAVARRQSGEARRQGRK